MTNRIDIYLDNQHKGISRAQEMALEQKRKEIVKAAWKTHCQGFISAFQYAEICRKNMRGAF